ncbi:MAG: hypothetical protein HXS40_12560 [Theionarchaea archaeon]|nr:hypothetical protein [Theionarchaea archaeon]
MKQQTAPLKRTVTQTLQSHTRFKIKERGHAGYGALPLGAPLSSMVAPGLLICGDAAGHTNPLTGEGIAPALAAGNMAATTAAQAIHHRDISLEALWKYNYDFMQKYGKLLGALVPLRDFMMSLSSKELNFLLQKVITDDVLSQLEQDEPSYALKHILTTAATAARNPSLLLKLGRALGKMNIIRAIYSRYPENPQKFPQWRRHAAAWIGS